MPIPYDTGPGEGMPWGLCYFKRQKTNSSLKLGLTERWFRKTFKTEIFYQMNAVITVVFGVSTAFSVYKVKSKFIH